MRRIMAGAGILALLLALGLYSSLVFREKIERLADYVEAASILYSDGDRTQALRLMELGIERWEDMELYTHVFIRHSQVDAVSEAFYEYMGDLRSGGGNDTGAREKLLYCLKITAEMEVPGLSTIF